MTLIAVVMNNYLFAFYSICVSCGFFILGCIWRGKGKSDKEADDQYWKEMKATKK